MKSIRRPLVAVGSTIVLVVLEALADPTGLLALVGWPGGHLQPALWWPLAPYVVFVPVLLAVVWWAAVRAGERFWTLTAGVTLAVLLAQAVACLAMTGDPMVSAWAAGYVTAKAVPAALVVAGVTRIAGGRRGERHPSPRVRPGSVWPAAVVFGATAPLLAGLWWTGATYSPLIPAPRADRGVLTMLLGVAVLILASWVAMRWMRRRVSGMLGVWLGAVVAGGILGLVQSVVSLVVDNGFAGDAWPAMAAYVHVADGLAFGACVGWIPALLAVVVDRVLARRAASTAAPAAAGTTGTAAGNADTDPSTDSTSGTPARRAGSTVALLTAVVAVVALVTAVATPAFSRPAAQLTASAPAGFLRADHGRITDGNGNQVLLRGVNVNQLVDFYQPRPTVPTTRPLTETDFAQIASYGFNVVRLDLSWSALEPQRGRLDSGYLARVRQAVRWAGDNGIRVVLDMHQDAWSNQPTPAGTQCRQGTDPMWGYDGAPGWATIDDGTPRCQFTGRDISPAGDRAFQHFYFDTDGIQTQLVNTWGELAGAFRDDPTIAGYDLLNEPGFGETAPVTASHLLGRYYDRAITAIRAAGAPQIVFVEPSILWSGLGFDSGPQPGFTRDRNTVFSPHLYAESITMDASLGLPTIVSTQRQFTLAQRVAAEYGAPLWSGEYGYWGSDASVQAHIERYAHAEDANVLGSAYWVWKQACGDPQNGITAVSYALVPEDCSTGADTKGNTALLDVLSRAYPRSAPGHVTHLSAHGSHIALTGTSSHRTCGLDVWLPGHERPLVRTTGVEHATLSVQPGGWQLTGCAGGGYSVSS